LKVLTCLTAIAILSGCAAQTRSGGDDMFEVKHELAEIHRNQGAQSAKIEELNHKLLLLADTKTQTPVEPKPIEALTTVPKVPDMPVVVAKTDLTGAERLYRQVLADLKQGKVAVAQKNVSLMMKGYKESPWTNNALFLVGENLFDHGQYLKAAEQYETLYKIFPDGNKAVSALYKLGVCYEKLGKPDEAHDAFQNVVGVYPGSQEAQMAQKKISQADIEKPETD
jgi:tol-pal system protein YbgF